MGTAAIIYWASTILFSVLMLMSGIGTVKLIVDSKRLGFPDYFRKQVAISKIVGALVLLIPFLPSTLREWTYTGFVVLLTSAIIARFSIKELIKSSVLPFILLAILFVSYFTFIQTQVL